ncbi:urea amidolyase associated protein UAAP1 [Methylopila turkensis]|uniref:Urea carboxylase n=1 Tax=Methylopila turkensis TaxID=1437816 RepID=A0A9W6JMX8_9HYPH|nr:urea amidolyase associated protein UAAP1 [Methylopila turkensis]GLK78634.1 urea carboxylase [Methylopila turkensis]
MTSTDPLKAKIIAERSAQYARLKAAGDAPKTLPPATARDGAPIDPAAVRERETLPGGWYWTGRIARGEALRVLNASGASGVSLFFWNAADTSERYNSADTIKVQWTSDLRKGRVLFSDMGRVMLSIVEDTCGAHDTVVGGSTPGSNLAKYGDSALRSTRENMILAASKFGLGARDLAPLLTLFAPVRHGADGRFAFRDGVVQPGDFVDLRAEMDLLVAVSNCPHPLAPDRVFDPGEVELIVHRSAPPEADDICRTATAEAVRGFENNARYLRAV